MSRFRAYIIPFEEDGNYQTTEFEVTEDIDVGSIGTVRQSIDNNQYAVGVLTYNDFNLKLRNEHGRYSKPGNSGSLFRFKRNDSIFRLYWQIDSELPLCGLAIAGRSRLSERKLIYEGFIKDDSTQESVTDQMTSLKVLSFESILSQIEVPNGVLSSGDTFEEAIFGVLNQAKLTGLLDVNVSNIVVGHSTTLDSVLSLAQKTGKEALDELLLMSNSILFIKERVVYVKGRDQTDAVAFNFYGPASLEGLENIQNISDIKSGVGKVFNYWTWKDGAFKVEDPTSISKWGIRKNSVASETVTNVPKQQAILASLAAEFADAKETLKLKTPLNYQTLPLYFMERVKIDYPTVYTAAPGKELPVYGISKYGQATYPIPGQFLTIPFEREWKILGVNIQIREQLLELELREV